MRLSIIQSLALSTAGLILAGCAAAPPPTRESVSKARGAVGACNPANSGHDCIHLNGDGVLVAAGDKAGLFASGAPAWSLVGFTSTKSGVVANGLYEGHVADAEITGASLDGRAVALTALHAQGSSVTAEIDGGIMLGDADLVRLVLALRVPAEGGAARRVSLRFGAAAPLAGRFDDVLGRDIELRDDDAGERVFTSYCQRGDGGSMPAVLAAGVQWSPADGARTQGDSRVGVTCESGAAATCMSWGYRPWASEAGESLADHHQACIHMKRAAYCGDARSFTTPGRGIAIADTLASPIQRGAVGRVEAVWTADGAACVGEPRAPEAGFVGCAREIPRCAPGALPEGHLLVSGLPR